MAEVPFEVMIQGPAAVMRWLDNRERRADQLIARGIEMRAGVMKACGLDPETLTEHPEKFDAVQVGAAIFAMSHTLTFLALVMSKGQRGTARDRLSQVLDDAFDVTQLQYERALAIVKAADKKARGEQA